MIFSRKIVDRLEAVGEAISDEVHEHCRVQYEQEKRINVALAKELDRVLSKAPNDAELMIKQETELQGQRDELERLRAACENRDLELVRLRRVVAEKDAEIFRAVSGKPGYTIDHVAQVEQMNALLRQDVLAGEKTIASLKEQLFQARKGTCCAGCTRGNAPTWKKMKFTVGDVQILLSGVSHLVDGIFKAEKVVVDQRFFAGGNGASAVIHGSDS